MRNYSFGSSDEGSSFLQPNVDSSPVAPGISDDNSSASATHPPHHSNSSDSRKPNLTKAVPVEESPHHSNSSESWKTNLSKKAIEELGKIVLRENQVENNHAENTKGPLLFFWNGHTHEQGEIFCQSKAMRVCPYKAYCKRQIPFHGIVSDDDKQELWSPVASKDQPVWVSVGKRNPCIQRGGLEKSDKNVKYILCC